MKDFLPDLIQVLWVEDDQKLTESLPMEAEDEEYGLQLVPFSCWDDAKEALIKYFDRWSAIILDAKCKYHKNSTDNAVVFLRESLKDISVICTEKGRLIPWYILSGGAETEISDSINDERLIWDEDWNQKKYYSKATDRDILFRRIKDHANNSPCIQIHGMYRNVFDAIKECGIDEEAKKALEDLLVPIHFPNQIEANNYNDKYKKARVFLEYLFRSMANYKILPNWGDEVNLRFSSLLLAGKDAKNKNGKVIVKNNRKSGVIPIALAKVMGPMIDILHAAQHSKSDDGEKVNMPEYLTSVDNSTFLLKSFVLQLCDIVLWYRNYIRKNTNKEINAWGWKKM